MYKLVNDAEIKPYRKFCTDTLVVLRDNLNHKYEIKTEFYLVGSGAKNLVTRDGNAPFDLDYNLRILEMPTDFWNNLKKLKDTVRNELNKIVGDTLFSDGQDSKSVITSNLILINEPNKLFSFDIAIMAKMENGNLCRLIHNKRQGDQFTWCEVPTSIDVRAKADELKQNSLWGVVRETYINKKNRYLTHNDYNHPSFVVYVETINEVWQKLQK